MIWHLLGMQKRPTAVSAMQGRIGKVRMAAAYRREVMVSFLKKTSWTEADVINLPTGEHDYFERKAGALIEGDRNNLLDDLAKAASAFANSGGGHLVIGVRNDGSFDGVPRLISGRETTRDWLEQKLPDLLDYRLNDFRVHVVERSNPSAIPNDRDIIVVDFGDSALAPHQSRRHTSYFYRSAGRSVHAPHFYLELLRQRMTAPDLEASLTALDAETGWEHNGELYVRLLLTFDVRNVGRMAAYKWTSIIEKLEYQENRLDDYIFGAAPGAPGRSEGVRIDDTLLPGCSLKQTHIFNVRLRPTARTGTALESEARLLLSKAAVHLRLATETSPGEQVRFELGPMVDYQKIFMLFVGTVQE